MAGAEIEALSGAADGTITGAVTRETGTKRTGEASWKCDSTAADCAVSFGPPDTSSISLFFRGYLNTADAASASRYDVLRIGSSAVGTIGIAASINSTGNIQLWRNDTDVQIGADGPVVNNSEWHLVELFVIFGSGGAISDCQLIVDGGSVASASSLSIGSATEICWGALRQLGRVVYWDDVAINDDVGSINNTWIGPGRVILMTPTSDSQVGSWTGGSGGTTNLFDAINNLPPAGTASESNTTQIESADSSGNNATDEYRGNCGTYRNKGIVPGSTIRAIKAWVMHGEDVNTNTKTGSFGFQSNPAVAYEAFTYGNDAGALGTYPTNWVRTSSLIEGPSIDVDSDLILGLRKTDTGTRVASVCFLGAYVDYTLSPTHVNMIPYRYN